MLIVLICKPYCRAKRAITGAHTPKKEEGVYNYSHQNTFDNHHIRARSFPRTLVYLHATDKSGHVRVFKPSLASRDYILSKVHLFVN